jgi:hypothetical protein
MSKSPRALPLVAAPVAANVLGLSRRQFDRLVTEGILKRAGEREFNLLVVGPAFMQYVRDGRERSSKLAEARLRHLEAQSKAVEQKNRERAGESVSLVEVERMFHEACAVLVQGCEAMPQRVSADPEIQVKVRDECRALRTLFADRLVELAGPSEPARSG